MNSANRNTLSTLVGMAVTKTEEEHTARYGAMVLLRDNGTDNDAIELIDVLTRCRVRKIRKREKPMPTSRRRPIAHSTRKWILRKT